MNGGCSLSVNATVLSSFSQLACLRAILFADQGTSASTRSLYKVPRFKAVMREFTFPD